MWKSESLFTVGNVNCYRHYGKQKGGPSKKKKNRIKLPYDPARLLFDQFF